MESENKERDEAGEEGVAKVPRTEPAPSTDSPEAVLARMLDDDPDKKRLIATYRRFSQTMTMPVPFPEIIEGYEQATPGGGKWLLDYTASQQEHRHGMENKEASFLSLGQIFGFVLGFVGLSGGILLAALGATASGLTVFFSSLIALVGFFVANKNGGDAEVKVLPEPPGDEDEDQQQSDS